jgi:hypothetical protein
VTIAYADVFPVIAEAMPDFEPSKEDWDNRLSYPFLSEMVRFVCDRSYPGGLEYEILRNQLAGLLEYLISEGDNDVHDLAHDALESVWDREERDVLAQHFGPVTRVLWRKICAGERGQ